VPLPDVLGGKERLEDPGDVSSSIPQPVSRTESMTRGSAEASRLPAFDGYEPRAAMASRALTTRFHDDLFESALVQHTIPTSSLGLPEAQRNSREVF